MKTLRWPLLATLGCIAALAAADPAQPRPASSEPSRTELVERVAAARALYNERGKSAEAQQAFEKIAATDPSCADAQYFLAQLALRRDDADKAVAYAEKSVALAPDNADCQNLLGDAYGRSAQKASVFSQFGLARKCLAAYQRAVALAPDKVEIHQNLFEYYRQAPGLVGGGSDKAENEAAAILKLDPLRGHTAYATLYTADKKFDQAHTHIAEIKKLDPNRGRMAAAALYVMEKKFDQALAEFDEVLKGSPDDYASLYQVGRLAATTGQFLDRGLTSLRRCLELTPGKNDPGTAAAQWRIGNILEKKNDPAGARAAYEAAVNLDPKFTPAADSLKKLK